MIMHLQDFEHCLTGEEYRQVVNNPEGKAAAKGLLRLENKSVSTITRDEFAKLCDCIMLRLLCCVVQRPGAIANLAIEEFQNGFWDRTNEPPLYVTETNVHKMSKTEGLVCLFWNAQLYRLATIYLEKLHPLVMCPVKSLLPLSQC
jgi:hypothetical protein